MKRVYFYDTSYGPIGIVEENGNLKQVFYGTNNDHHKGLLEETPFIKKTYQQLLEYFEGARTEFDLPLDPDGTPFQKKVWEALETIPYGETRSYLDIATQIGNEKACRAIGMANHQNPIGIIIPCHRVIGKNGTLTGYAGGLDIKQRLLELEKTRESKSFMVK